MAMLVTLLTQTTKWEVVKICTSPKRPFFFFSSFSEHFRFRSKSAKPEKKYCYRTEPIPLTDRERKKKKKEKKKVSLHRFEPGPLTLIDIGRYA